MHRTRLVATATLAVLSIASPRAADAGTPELVPTQINGSMFSIPKGWTVSSTTQPVPAFQAEETAGAADSPSIHVTSYPLTHGEATATMHADEVRASMASAKLVSRSKGPHGSVVEVWDGSLGGVDARMSLLYWANTAQGVGMTGVFAAPPERHAALGGSKLLLEVLGVANAPVKSAKVAKAKPKKTSAASSLSIPKKYASSATPTLYFVAENVHALSGAQVAQALRTLNTTEWQLLGAYSAFANLLHGMACGADAGIALPTPSGAQSCRTTMTQWAQTLQLTQGDKTAALDYAFRQREQMLIGMRCSNGQIGKQACQAYIAARRQDITNSHNTMIRIIANLSNGCVVGDPDCVPY